MPSTLSLTPTMSLLSLTFFIFSFFFFQAEDGIRDHCVTGVQTCALPISLTRDIQSHVKTRLAAHEYPREVEFVDTLPMTATGKILRRELRARAVAASKPDRKSVG